MASILSTCPPPPVNPIAWSDICEAAPTSRRSPELLTLPSFQVAVNLSCVVSFPYHCSVCSFHSRSAGPAQVPEDHFSKPKCSNRWFLGLAVTSRARGFRQPLLLVFSTSQQQHFLPSANFPQSTNTKEVLFVVAYRRYLTVQVFRYVIKLPVAP